jgi:transcriptional regulator with XRE-family HTH domain
MDIRQVVGANLRQERERQGLSQEELAFRADLHRTYVSGVERVGRNPTIKIVAQLAKALGVAPATLLANDNHG